METDELNKIIAQCQVELQDEEGRIKSSLGHSPALDDEVGVEFYAAHIVTHGILVKKLRQIERARERLRLGNYGVCQRCNTPMWERLLALPYAELCRDCQTIADGAQPRRISMTKIETN